MKIIDTLTNLASPKGPVRARVNSTGRISVSMERKSKCHVRAFNKGSNSDGEKTQIEKDGRYFHTKYIDSFENRNLFTQKLVATDRVPAGKRDSLREKIAELQKNMMADVVGKKMTLCQLYAKQNAQRPKVTETGRKYLMDILQKTS